MVLAAYSTAYTPKSRVLTGAAALWLSTKAAANISRAAVSVLKIKKKPPKARAESVFCPRETDFISAAPQFGQLFGKAFH